MTFYTYITIYLITIYKQTIINSNNKEIIQNPKEEQQDVLQELQKRTKNPKEEQQDDIQELV